MTKDHIPSQNLRVRYSLLIKTQSVGMIQIDHGLSAHAQRTMHNAQCTNDTKYYVF